MGGGWEQGLMGSLKNEKWWGGPRLPSPPHLQGVVRPRTSSAFPMFKPKTNSKTQKNFRTTGASHKRLEFVFCQSIQIIPFRMHLISGKKIILKYFYVVIWIQLIYFLLLLSKNHPTVPTKFYSQLGTVCKTNFMIYGSCCWLLSIIVNDIKLSFILREFPKNPGEIFLVQHNAFFIVSYFFPIHLQKI